MAVEFTVVIPSHNRGDLIGETLDAVLAQTLKPQEIIVVDDGSTDNTSDVLAGYAGQITVKRVPSCGPQAKRDFGISLAKTDWVAHVDSDDLWLPNYLHKQAELLSAEPGIGMSFGNFCIFRDGLVEPKSKFDEAPAGFWENLGARPIPQGLIFDRSIAAASFRFHPIFPSAMVVSRTRIASVGGFNSHIPLRVEDGEYTLRCLYRLKVAAIREPLVYIRKHASNMSGNLVLRLVDEVTALHHIKEHHSEALPYRHIIDDEIEIRTTMALNAAFSSKDHATAAALYRRLPPARRSMKLRVKAAVSGMPSFLGLPLNASLQAIKGGGKKDSGVR
jgi:glycosyltransferase involved in cell wall biosynthesis